MTLLFLTFCKSLQALRAEWQNYLIPPSGNLQELTTCRLPNLPPALTLLTKNENNFNIVISVNEDRISTIKRHLWGSNPPLADFAVTPAVVTLRHD